MFLLELFWKAVNSHFDVIILYVVMFLESRNKVVTKQKNAHRLLIYILHIIFTFRFYRSQDYLEEHTVFMTTNFLVFLNHRTKHNKQFDGLSVFLHPGRPKFNPWCCMVSCLQLEVMQGTVPVPLNVSPKPKKKIPLNQNARFKKKVPCILYCDNIANQLQTIKTSKLWHFKVIKL